MGNSSEIVSILIARELRDVLKKLSVDRKTTIRNIVETILIDYLKVNNKTQVG